MWWIQHYFKGNTYIHFCPFAEVMRCPQWDFCCHLNLNDINSTCVMLIKALNQRSTTSEKHTPSFPITQIERLGFNNPTDQSWQNIGAIPGQLNNILQFWLRYTVNAFFLQLLTGDDLTSNVTHWHLSLRYNHFRDTLICNCLAVWFL